MFALSLWQVKQQPCHGENRAIRRETRFITREVRAALGNYHRRRAAKVSGCPEKMTATCDFASSQRLQCR